MSYDDIIQKHKSVGQLKDVSMDFLLELRKSRNYVAHGYEHPDFQVIYEFYKLYKNEFDKVISCIRNTIYEAQNSESKEDRKQKDELYSSLEMAKKLIPLLEGTDEEISEKTEKFIEQIKMSYVNKSRSFVYVQNLVVSVINLLELPEELEEEIYDRERWFMNQINRCENLDEVAKRIHETFKFIENVMLKQRDSYGKRQAMLALDYIEKNYADSSVTLNSVCSALAMSTSYFSSIFKNYTGETFIECLTKKRMEKAKTLLRTTNLQVQTVAQHCGILDIHYFSKMFKGKTGQTPKEYRQNNI
jgi:YesN/AraC family two-component response regulator